MNFINTIISKFNLRLEGTVFHEKCSSKLYDICSNKYYSNKAESKVNSKETVKVMFYFFKNVHIPILIPIYQKLTLLYPNIRISKLHFLINHMNLR